MLKLFKYLSLKEWIMAFVSLGFIIFQVFLDLRLPDYMNAITKLVNTPGSSLKDIWLQGGWMLLTAFGSLVSSVVVSFFGAKIATTFAKTLRSEMFGKVEKFSLEEINSFSTASLITRSTNDISQIQQFITMGLQIIIKAPILAVWAIFKISGKGYEWTMATGVTVLLLLIVITIILLLVLPKFKKMQELTDNLNHVTRENLRGIRVVRAYNAEKYEKNKFAVANEELTDTVFYTSKTMAVLMPLINLLINVLTIAIYLIGASLINNAGLGDRLEIYSNTVVYSSYAMQVIMAFMMMVMIFMLLPRSTVAARRINEVLKKEIVIKDGFVNESSSNLKGSIEFKNVSFKYPDAAEYVLKDINLSIKQGETVAFIGSTGSGKSTLINLVPRFYDVTEGEILINGIDIKDYQLNNLYNKIGYVPQKAVLFKGSVNFNVTYGDSNVKYSEENLKNAVRIAQAKDFVESMEEGYNADIAQSGTNLSGGQKQRVSIARAIYKDPEIYIFDDSFSALDYKTDFELRKVLKAEMGEATNLIVAQRIGTIIDADKIVVLDSGKIVGIGKHRELLETCSVYQEIAHSQLSEEELR